MNCNAFARKVETYEKLLKKPYWHLFEVAEYVSDVTSLDIFEFLPPMLQEAFQLKRLPIGSHAAFHEEGRQDVCIDNYDRILRIIYNSIQKDKIEAYPVTITFMGRGSSIENEFPHLKNLTYLVRPLEALYLLITEGIILPKELQSVLQISQISNAGVFTKGSLNNLKRDAVSQVIRFENPEDNLKRHRERLKKLREMLKINRSIERFFEQQKVTSKNYESFWKQDFSDLSLALHFLHTDTGNRPATAFSNTKPDAEGALPHIPFVMQEQEEHRMAFDFQKMKEALKIVSALLLFKYENLTSKDLLHHPLIQMYGSAGGDSVTEITKFILKDILKTLDFFASSSTDPIL